MSIEIDVGYGVGENGGEGEDIDDDDDDDDNGRSVGQEYVTRMVNETVSHSPLAHHSHEPFPPPIPFASLPFAAARLAKPVPSPAG